jgi:hypothetical protein
MHSVVHICSGQRPKSAGTCVRAGNAYARASAYVDCLAKAIVKIYAYAFAYAYVDADCQGTHKQTYAYADIYVTVDAWFNKEDRCYTDVDVFAIGDAWAKAKATGTATTVRSSDRTFALMEEQLRIGTGSTAYLQTCCQWALASANYPSTGLCFHAPC